MENTPDSNNTPTKVTSTYSPSVPISLYREVVAELQASQAMLDSLNTQNHQLTKQNQQLRQEVEQVVQSVVRLQKTIDSLSPVSSNFAAVRSHEHPLNPAHSSPSFNSPIAFESHTSSTRENATGENGSASLELTPRAPEPSLPSTDFNPESLSLVTEQADHRYRRGSRRVGSQDFGAAWLAIAIVVILSAFGLGFWVVRPLLMNTDR
ncbi:hypothetical protein [Oxynema aestuarii]|jgi:hypothetical protein|uniref:Uncharacterized protein n=1 Tax=Oxynema aestuarii AP17 TaxID=2064643 RepID=A0A6H1TXF7_9CYAN|nr:hypothetical protein [Oxynema aestuarii]QIZ70039.1 hypothetical protein HCG48_05210 [Oxynema aestuarii AP17]RMH74702.1 MAG: hypothetical protein D6680_14000 [Cyanobacteria bacterium J007]